MGQGCHMATKSGVHENERGVKWLSNGGKMVYRSWVVTEKNGVKDWIFLDKNCSNFLIIWPIKG